MTQNFFQMHRRAMNCIDKCAAIVYDEPVPLGQNDVRAKKWQENDMKNDITIRAATPADAAALRDIYAPYVLGTAITFEYDPPTIGEFARRIENTLEMYPYLVAERKGRVIGYAYASRFHPRAAYQWCAEASIYVRMDERGGGVGRALYEALEEALRRQGILNLNACIAWAQEEDEHLSHGSAAFHERMGYRLVGRFSQCGYKFGRWYDMIWMEKMLGGHGADVQPIRPFREVWLER